MKMTRTVNSGVDDRLREGWTGCRSHWDCVSGEGGDLVLAMVAGGY